MSSKVSWILRIASLKDWLPYKHFLETVKTGQLNALGIKKGGEWVDGDINGKGGGKRKGLANVLLAGRHWLCLRMSLSIKNDCYLMGKRGKKSVGKPAGEKKCVPYRFLC
ncbi:hypothetical protein ACIQZM_00405 [Peribacillus sp. NPDC097206]|uniref:hypothetical protein n=1 Tax=Peribacillus sp. NPDC097206 TaxID=3364398 RepID=UPI00380B1BEE